MVAKAVYDNASSTPEPYQFSLLATETNQLVRLKTPPLEWESGTIQIDRDIDIGGVFTSFNVESLTFVKEGAAFLTQLWNDKEFNAQCDLIVEWFKPSIKDYVEMPTRFTLNFATAKPRVKVGNQSIGFLINATKEDILVKLENRKDKEVDITKTTSIGGYPITPYSSLPYTGLKKFVNYPDVEVGLISFWVGDYSVNNDIDNSTNREILTQFDMQFAAQEFPESQEVEYRTNFDDLTEVVPFFFKSNEQRDLKFLWSFTIEVTNNKTFGSSNKYAVIYDVYDEDGNIRDNQTEIIADVGDDRGSFSFSDTRTISLEVNDSVRVYIKTDKERNINAHIRAAYFSVEQDIITYEGRTLEAVPLYNCFERVLQHISDIQFPFYSEFLGKTDDVYNQNGNTYAAENQLRFASVMSGLNLRGAPLFLPDNPLAMSFDDLFGCGNALYSLGYEVEEIDNFNRIRIENYDYFFQDVECIDLSDRIKKYDVEIEAMPELAYAEVKSGFEDYDYEQINGRGEYNTESSRTTVLNTKETYEIKSKIRGDSMAMNAKITQELTTEDTKEDNELFILKTQRDVDDWKPEKQENITIENGSSLFEDDSFNLYYTPARMFYRHGSRVVGGLTKFMSSYFRFQKSNKSQTLQTTGEGRTIIENQDIQAVELDDPIWRPVKYVVTCEITWEDLEVIFANKKGYITLTSEYKGYLLSLKKTNNENRATIELIQKA